YVADGASINPDQTGVSADQSVRIAAGSDTATLGVSGVLTAGGTLSVGPAMSLSMMGNQTEAFIGVGATVNAMDDVDVLAFGNEKVLSISAGLAA
ncbi:MAG: hypothetical protein GWN73_27165, partial [Actinobacteria bacterium]|nr:hypothetical protein [Actinomycetota bacterium]NIU68892.1 hypothetical protein [Actinomycetota bacterium]NIW30741.1 hypothetical protein [Actinomycetota bacterium]